MQLLRLLILIAGLTPATLLAGDFEPRARRYPLGTLLDDVALNAVAATRTLTVDLDNAQEGYDVVVVYVDHTNVTGALNITMDCTIKPSATDSNAYPQECTLASGVCTSDNSSWKKVVSASGLWLWRVDIAGYPGQVDCVFAAAGAAAGDKVTVKGWMVTQ